MIWVGDFVRKFRTDMVPVSFVDAKLTGSGRLSLTLYE